MGQGLFDDKTHNPVFWLSLTFTSAMVPSSLIARPVTGAEEMLEILNPATTAALWGRPPIISTVPDAESYTAAAEPVGLVATNPALNEVPLTALIAGGSAVKSITTTWASALREAIA